MDSCNGVIVVLTETCKNWLWGEILELQMMFRPRECCCSTWLVYECERFVVEKAIFGAYRCVCFTVLLPDKFTEDLLVTNEIMWHWLVYVILPGADLAGAQKRCPLGGTVAGRILATYQVVSKIAKCSLFWKISVLLVRERDTFSCIPIPKIFKRACMHKNAGFVADCMQYNSCWTAGDFIDNTSAVLASKYYDRAIRVYLWR